MNSIIKEMILKSSYKKGEITYEEYIIELKKIEREELYFNQADRLSF